MNLFCLDNKNKPKSSEIIVTRVIKTGGRIISKTGVINCKVMKRISLKNPGSVDLSTPGLHVGKVNKAIVCYWLSAKSPLIYVLPMIDKVESTLNSFSLKQISD